MNWFEWLFSNAGFMPRAVCGIWTPGMIFLHNASDFLIWTAYIAIPLVLVRFAYAKRRELPFRNMFWLFGLFILACGTTHLMDIVMFYNPLYPLAGVIKLITALASWGTVFALFHIAPLALLMRSPEDLEREIDQRQLAEADLQRAHDNLEERVLERTKALEQTNAQLQFAKEEAERANAAKGEFLSRMSHELRTPLNAILGFSQLLQLQDEQFDSEQKEDIGHIVKAGQHLLGLVNEVLDITRIEAPDSSLSLEPVLLNGVVQESLDMMQTLAAASKISVRQNISPQSPLFVLADQQRLLQILLNLLSNAIKYNKPGGEIVISEEVLPNERVQFHIQDTGHGIAEEDLAKLFVPFSRLNAEKLGVEGTGLGLVLCRRLAEAMDGSLNVESRAGIGSTFTIELPQAQAPDENLVIPPAAPTSETPDLAVATLTSRHTILLIEDNISNFHLIERMLKSRTGIRLLGAIQGGFGIELAQQHQPDLILLDLHLPDIMGDEVLRRLRAIPETQNIPVIILSADATPGQITRLMNEGARKYLTKPLDVQEFFQVIDETFRES